MNKKLRKTNYIIIGAISISLVSLVSVGFATWIIGLEDIDKEVSTSINIEGLEDKTIIVNASIKNGQTSIVVDPNYDPNAIISGDQTTSRNMQFGIDFEIAIPNEKTLSSFTLSSSEITVTKNNADVNSISVTNSLFRTLGDYLYLSTDNVNFITSDTKLTFTPYSEMSGYKVAKYSYNYTVNFGSMFKDGSDQKTPEAFYNDKLQTYKDAYQNATGENKDTAYQSYLNALNVAKGELEAMSKSLNGATYTIKLGVNYEFAQ